MPGLSNVVLFPNIRVPFTQIVERWWSRGYVLRTGIKNPKRLYIVKSPPPPVPLSPVK